MWKPSSFEDYVTARGPALLRLAFLLTGNQADAEDLTQGALLRTMLKWRRVERADDIDRYVYRILVRRHVDFWRRRSSSERATGDLDTIPEASVGTDATEQVDDRDLLRTGLDKLSRAQRAVLVLRYYEDCTDATISDLLGIPATTVRSHASRGLKTLRRELQTTDGQDIEAPA